MFTLAPSLNVNIGLRSKEKDKKKEKLANPAPMTRLQAEHFCNPDMMFMVGIVFVMILLSGAVLVCAARH